MLGTIGTICTIIIKICMYSQHQSHTQRNFGDFIVTCVSMQFYVLCIYKYTYHTLLILYVAIINVGTKYEFRKNNSCYNYSLYVRS